MPKATHRAFVFMARAHELEYDNMLDRSGARKGSSGGKSRSGKRLTAFARFGITKRSQIVTKSDQWYTEVVFLHRHLRYASVLYLGGFVVECLLKAALWKHRSDKRVHEMIFKSHDLEELLGAAPMLMRQMENDPLGTYSHFVKISGWHIRIRYNPKRVGRDDASSFFNSLQEVRGWLRNKV